MNQPNTPIRAKDLGPLGSEYAQRVRQRSTRRLFLQQGMAGLGALWMGTDTQAAAPTQHFAPKAKRAIFLHMAGAPSQFELFDHKPELNKRTGQRCPSGLIEGERFAFVRGAPDLLGAHFPLHQHAETGMWVSDRMPNFEKVMDKVCFVRSMQTDQFNHAPAQLLVQTGSPRSGGASIGSWVTYGLGTENQDLPGFVVLL